MRLMLGRGSSIRGSIGGVAIVESGRVESGFRFFFGLIVLVPESQIPRLSARYQGRVKYAPAND